MKTKFIHIRQSILSFYQRHERPVMLLSFVGGFLWDSLTLTRIDRLSDNLILLGYLFLFCITIILDHARQGKQTLWQLPEAVLKWAPVAAQFFLGGLMSSYLVFYFHSANLSKDWLFLIILVAFWVSNEFLPNRLRNYYLQQGLLLLAGFSFFIFFVPVLTHQLNWAILLLSALLGLLPVLATSFIIYRWVGTINRTTYRRGLATVLFLFILLLGAYQMNWIPPVPLSVKHAGIYHRVEKIEGDFHLTYEAPPFYRFWQKSESNFHYQQGDTIFCFAAVFAPTRLQKEIIHEWQWWDEQHKEWKTSDRLRYRVVGGRAGGYRGFTRKGNIREGNWRVNILTDDNRLLGRIKFCVKIDSTRKTRRFKEWVYN